MFCCDRYVFPTNNLLPGLLEVKFLVAGSNAALCWHVVPITSTGWGVAIRAAESTNFKRLRLQLILRPENIDSDSNSDSASTPTQQGIFFPKKAM